MRIFAHVRWRFFSRRCLYLLKLQVLLLLLDYDIYTYILNNVCFSGERHRETDRERENECGSKQT